MNLIFKREGNVEEDPRGCPSLCELRLRRLGSLIYSPSLFSDLSVKGLRIWEDTLEQAPFMAAGRSF